MLPGGQARSVREREADLTWRGHWSGLHGSEWKRQRQMAIGGTGETVQNEGKTFATRRDGNTKRPKDAARPGGLGWVGGLGDSTRRGSEYVAAAQRDRGGSGVTKTRKDELVGNLGGGMFEWREE